MAKIRIAIDAGHCSTTAGKRTAPFKKNVDINNDGKIDVKKGEQFKEHIANVGIASLLYKELIKRGYDVLKVGWNDENAYDDKDISLSGRQQKIRNFKSDYSISIHFNASGGDGMTFNNASGVLIYIHDRYAGDSKTLAHYVISELVKGSKQTNRGIAGQALALVNCSKTKCKASILIENAFMTNEHEAEDLMANTKYWKEQAIQIADGLDKYIENLNKDIGIIYTVKRGDSLSGISRKLLGNASRYGEIMKLNNMADDELGVGQIIKIPKK